MDAGHQPGKGGDLKMANTHKIGRNAGNGQFTSVATAKGKPGTHVVETIKNR
jgi:hypothetical protein